MWEFLGKNIYLNNVYENKETKQRKIVKNNIEILEDINNKVIDFNRVFDKETENMLLNNILKKSFLNSYKKSLSKIFYVFYDEVPNNENEKYSHFINKIKQIQNLFFIENWKAPSYDFSHIEWDKWLNLNNSTGFKLGIQYALGNFLKDKKYPILEFGVNKDIDAASIVSPLHYIYAKEKTFFKFSPLSFNGEQDYLNINNENYLLIEFKKILNVNNVENNKENKKPTISKFNINKKDVFIEKKLIKNNKNPKNSKEESHLSKLIDKKVIKVIWDDEKKHLNETIPFLIKEKHKFIFITKKLKTDFQLKIFNNINSFIENGNIIQRKIIVNNLEEKNILAVIWFFNFNRENKLKEIVTLQDFCAKEGEFWKLPKIDFEVFSSERERYSPLSKTTQPTGMISTKIAKEVKGALLAVEKEKGDLDKWVSKLLKIEKNSLSERLSSEQIDAISLGVSSLLKDKGLVIADETGFGKGRILAAISIIGLILGKTVLFFTENKQLFSDFYRDILAVKEEQNIIPLILNQTGKIYDPNGNLIVKNKTINKFKEMIENKTQWEKGEDKFIITNYAQINRKGVNQPKMKFLEKLMGEDSWIILDESHNASGNSNINENLKYLIKKSNGVVFSSATYAKTEEKLSIYDKAIPLSNIAKKLIKISLFGDNGDLRELITKEMAKQGNFIRREHPPIELPEILFIDSEEIQNKIKDFILMWQKIFEFVELREEMFGYFSARSWLTIGAILQRSIREFSMLCKIKDLSNLIEKFIKENEKVVLVTEITFEAILRNLVENQSFNFEENNEEEKTSDNEDIIKTKNKEISFEEEPKWNWKWISLLEDLMSEERLEKELYFRKKEADFSMEKYLEIKSVLEEKKEKLQEYILNIDFFGLSPLDELKNLLKNKNIKMGELSGRTYQIEEKNGKWFINNKLEKKERTELVNAFNSGLLDVMLITRAGASGISLHAGAKFKDQRKRRLIELDIATNSANRIQFLGRVRRKDQVIEPAFNTLSLKTTFDVRKIEVEKRKQILLSAHVGGRKENNILDWISEEGEMIIEEWSKENKEWAKKIGCFNLSTQETTKKIDRALSRSLILPQKIQEDLFSRIEKGIENHTNYHFFKNRNLPLSQNIFEKKLWGNYKSIYETEGDNSILNLEYITMNQRLWFINNVFDLENKHDFLIYNNLLDDISKKIYLNKTTYKEKINVMLDSWKMVNEKENNKYRDNVLKQVENLFKNFSFGSEFYWMFNGKMYFKKGCFIDIHYNEELTNTNFNLNNIGLEVYFENEKETIVIPLIFFFKKEQFKITNTIFDKNNYINRLKDGKIFNSFKTTTIEGNPILISSWNKMLKIGSVENIIDVNQGSKSILILPKNITFKEIENYDIPFISEKQIIDYINNKFYSHSFDKGEKNKKIEFKINFNPNQNEDFYFSIIKEENTSSSFQNKMNVSYSICFRNDESYNNEKRKGWILKANRFIKERKVIDGKLNLILHSKKIYEIISLLKGEGVFFFIPKEEKEWFQSGVKKYI